MKPIIFNTEMVQAILDGRKTQTRRIIKNIPANAHRCDAEAGLEWSAHWGKSGEDYNGKAWFADYSKIVKPKYIAADVIWVDFVGVHVVLKVCHLPLLQFAHTWSPSAISAPQMQHWFTMPCVTLSFNSACFP